MITSFYMIIPSIPYYFKDLNKMKEKVIKAKVSNFI